MVVNGTNSGKIEFEWDVTKVIFSSLKEIKLGFNFMDRFGNFAKF